MISSINLKKFQQTAKRTLSCHGDFDAQPTSSPTTGQDRVTFSQDSGSTISGGQILAGATAAGTLLGGATGIAKNLMSAPGPAYRVEVFTRGGTPANPEFHDYDVHHQKTGNHIFVDGLQGAALGAGAGLILGATTVGLRKILGHDSEALPLLAQEEKKNVVVGGAIGAAVGASAGAISALTKAQVAPAHSFSIPINGKFPDMNDIQGRPATDLVDHLMGQSSLDMVVKGAEPIGKASIGPGLVTSMLGGGAVGLISGIGGGIAFNALKKVL